MAGNRQLHRRTQAGTRVKRSEVRRKILESARKLFMARGLAATSLDAISSDAGFSKGAVYSNFTNKDELCFELLSSGIDARIATVEKVMTTEAEPERQVGLAGDRLLGIVESEPGWQTFFVELWLRCVRNPALRKRFAAKRRLMRGQIALLLTSQAKAAGYDLPIPAEYLASYVLALSNGLGMEGQIDADAVPKSTMGRLLGWTFRGMLAETQEHIEPR